MSKMSELDAKLRYLGIDPESVDLNELEGDDCILFDGGACSEFGEVSEAFCDKCSFRFALGDIL
uniref:Uncharacterized protein n=1 Tax=viral metagenome TaxID=1070528 RepID=A0A6H1ZH61_9ZZZZ